MGRSTFARRSAATIALVSASVAFAAPAWAGIPPDPRTTDVAPAAPAPVPTSLARVLRLDEHGPRAGSPVALVAARPGSGFDWTDTGIAAGSAAAAAVLAAGLIAGRRGRHAAADRPVLG